MQKEESKIINNTKVVLMPLCRIERRQSIGRPGFNKVDAGKGIIYVNNIESITDYTVPVYEKYTYEAARSDFNSYYLSHYKAICSLVTLTSGEKCYVDLTIDEISDKINQIH